MPARLAHFRKASRFGHRTYVAPSSVVAHGDGRASPGDVIGLIGVASPAPTHRLRGDAREIRDGQTDVGVLPQPEPDANLCTVGGSSTMLRWTSTLLPQAGKQGDDFTDQQHDFFCKTAGTRPCPVLRASFLYFVPRTSCTSYFVPRSRFVLRRSCALHIPGQPSRDFAEGPHQDVLQRP